MSNHNMEVLRKLQEDAWDSGLQFLATLTNVPTDELEALKKHNPHRKGSSR